jgi:hypothetical protein
MDWALEGRETVDAALQARYTPPNLLYILTILKWIVKKYGLKMSTVLGSRQWSVAGCCEQQWVSHEQFPKESILLLHEITAIEYFPRLYKYDVL